jgi:hypothetical protein
MERSRDLAPQDLEKLRLDLSLIPVRAGRGTIAEIARVTLLAPTTGSVLANPVNVLLRSVGGSHPSKYRRNPSRLFPLLKEVVKRLDVLL